MKTFWFFGNDSFNLRIRCEGECYYGVFWPFPLPKLFFPVASYIFYRIPEGALQDLGSELLALGFGLWAQVSELWVLGFCLWAWASGLWAHKVPPPLNRKSKKIKENHDESHIRGLGGSVGGGGHFHYKFQEKNVSKVPWNYSAPFWASNFSISHWKNHNKSFSCFSDS